MYIVTTLDAQTELSVCRRLFFTAITYECALKKCVHAILQEAEPLNIFVSSGLPKAFADASKLAQNLIDTVRGEHAKAYPYTPTGGPPAVAGGPPAYGGGLPPYGTAPPYSAGPYGYPPPAAAPYA